MSDNLPASTTASTAISPLLSAQLTSEPSNEVAVRMIAQNPQLLAEVERMLPVLTAKAKAPAGRVGVRNVVGRRMPLYPPPKMSDAAMEAWWADYIAILGDLPESALEAGMQAWIKRPESQFMPKPGELRQLALTAENKAVRAYERAKGALAWQAPRSPGEALLSAVAPRMMPRAPAPADRAKVRAIAEEFGRQSTGREDPRPSLPVTHGKADASGITPALREIMQKRGDL